MALVKSHNVSMSQRKNLRKLMKMAGIRLKMDYCQLRCLCFLLLLSCPFRSQTQQIETASDSVGNRVHCLTPIGFASIEQDLDDHIWMAADLGLLRYDGYEKFRKKILQPFFSKNPPVEDARCAPTLAFYIVSKRHQNEILVKIEEEVDTEFQIILPNNPNL